MELTRLYASLSDRTRLRILNLLFEGPLCVCHFQEILKEPQVKISKHLGYLKRCGLVVSERDGHWMIYSLPEKRSSMLSANLKCLRMCLKDDSRFEKDLTRWQQLRRDVKRPAHECGQARKACCSS